MSAQSFNSALFKRIAFIFIIFPFISHIYGAVFPALYNFQIVYVCILMLSFTTILCIRQGFIKFDKNIIYFFPFVIVSLADSLYNNNVFFIKYLFYMLIYFLILRKFFMHQFIFKLYINILVVTFLILFYLYLVTSSIDFDLSLYFRVSDLQYLSSNAPIHLEPHKGQIFYFLVYTPGDFSGIFPFSRFHGFSREPGFYVTFIIPAFFMACFFKMKFQAFILGFAIFVTSSFAGYVVMLIAIIIMLTQKISYKLFNRKISFHSLLFFIITLLLLVVLLRQNLLIFDIQRVSDYVKIIDNYLVIYTSQVSGFSLLKLLFILQKITFGLIVYHFFRKVCFVNVQIVFLFFISFIIMFSKANELISPLFLFNLLFVDYLYLRILNNRGFENNPKISFKLDSAPLK